MRVDDHFSGAPWPAEVAVSLDVPVPPVPVRGATGIRHPDGTYRFAGLAAGAYQLAVAAPDGTAFPWTATTAVVLPLATPTDPVVVELWPSPSARLPPGTVVVRGRLASAPAGQEVQIECVGAPVRNRKTRCDAGGEFVFVVLGQIVLTSTYLVELEVVVPGRTVTTIQILDGDTDPITAGDHVSVLPGRETRLYVNLL